MRHLLVARASDARTGSSFLAVQGHDLVVGRRREGAAIRRPAASHKVLGVVAHGCQELCHHGAIAAANSLAGLAFVVLVSIAVRICAFILAE